MFALDGVAVVTGASSGFGEHFARLLASRGMTVVAAARRIDRLEALAASTENIVACGCDVVEDGQLAELVRFARQHGPLRLLVNNAGITDGTARAIDEDPSEFRGTVEVNLNAVFVLSSLAARAMVDDGVAGSIVNIASIYGFVASAPNTQAAYVASKHGVIGLTRELAAQWARHDIRVNAIAPGYFRSELTDEMLATESGRSFIERNTMLRRPGEVRELDGALLLLASAAGSYITGQTIVVDGGWTAH
jgi:NAD(P)-dependent dehydrogenase (short-subunit alcohol dehydrogenase family)